MLKRLLVGLDGSKYADSAVKVALEIARVYDAVVAGLAVVDLPGIEKHTGGAPAGAIYYAEKEEKDKLADAQKKAKTFLESFKTKCKEADVRYELISRTGSPYEVIIEESKTTDLVVVGMRTYFHYETQDDAGETLKKLLQETPSPVLAVPEDIRFIKHVLLTYDGSVQAARAIRMRVHLTKKMPINWTVLVVTEDQDEGQRLVQSMSRYLKAHEIDAETLILPGQPDDVIMQVARKLSNVQVVMGAYGQHGLRELLFGSTAKKLIEDGSIPLFIYH